MYTLCQSRQGERAQKVLEEALRVLRVGPRSDASLVLMQARCSNHLAQSYADSNKLAEAAVLVRDARESLAELNLEPVRNLVATTREMRRSRMGVFLAFGLNSLLFRHRAPCRRPSWCATALSTPRFAMPRASSTRHANWRWRQTPCAKGWLALRYVLSNLFRTS